MCTSGPQKAKCSPQHCQTFHGDAGAAGRGGVEAAQFLGAGVEREAEPAVSEAPPCGGVLAGTVGSPRLPSDTRPGWYPSLARPLAATPGTPPAELGILRGCCQSRAGSCPCQVFEGQDEGDLILRDSPHGNPSAASHWGTLWSMPQRVLHALPYPSLSLLSPARTYPFLPLAVLRSTLESAQPL